MGSSRRTSALAARRRRAADPPGGGVRQPHPLVPQRPLRRLQDRRGRPEPELLAQFDLAELATRALGIVVWSMRRVRGGRRAGHRRGALRAHGVEQVRILHPRQGPRAVPPSGRRSCRWTGCGARSWTRPALRAAPGHRAREHPRLARPGRRHRRRHPGPAGLRREVGRRGARPLRAARGDPRRRGSLGRGGPRARSPGRLAPRAGARTRFSTGPLATLRTDVPLARGSTTSSGGAPTAAISRRCAARSGRRSLLPRVARWR